MLQKKLTLKLQSIEELLRLLLVFLRLRPLNLLNSPSLKMTRLLTSQVISGSSAYLFCHYASDGKPMQEAAVINDDALPVVKHSRDMVQEPITLLTHSEIEAILKKEKASSSSVYVELMPHYP